MNEELLALLARLNEPGDNPLTSDELTTLLDGLRARADELRDADRTDETVTELQTIASAVGAVRTEQAARAETAAERDRQAQEALDAISASDDEDSDDGDDTATGDATDETAIEDVAPDAPVVTDTAPVAVAASTRPSLAAVRAPAPARRSTPQPVAARATQSLTAAGDLPGFSAGAEIPTVEALADAASRKLRSMGGGGRALIASIRTEFPEERMLHTGDVPGNERKYAEAIAPAALTAAGGICAPLAVDYSVPTFASADRPVRDALVRFGAERGGITFVTPPKLADGAAGVGIWTEAVDTNPSGATKAVYTMSCPGTTSVEVDAITTIVQMGNMQNKYSPEYVGAVLENLGALTARTAELNLLAKIHALSTEVTDAAQTTGATRASLAIIDRAKAAMKARLRLSDSARFRVILPSWFKDMVRTDLAKEIANGTDRLAITDEQIAAYFSVRGINITWQLDEIAAQGSGRTYGFQGFAAQSAGALAAWPTQVVFPLFPEGSFQFLDGGELNLGAVRDSTLNATNDLQMFSETFENVAFRGIESDWVIATLAPTGASAGTVTPA